MKHDFIEATPKASQTTTAGEATNPTTLVEVWGDTVDLHHLAWSVALGVAISLGAFEAGQRALAVIVHDAAIVRAYAMLVGLAGCLLAGAICARLFKPKRTVVEHTADEAERMNVLAQLAAEAGGIGRLADAPASARAEMEELGLLELFAAFEASGTDGVPRDETHAAAPHLPTGAR
ncbi:hypothetical protein [Paraburkholderia sp.]|uniref:hypothetical protein n=1 Tax=Paraburkholderia sp. TaxID=1926495 RepID=UPI003D6F7A72